MNLEALTQDVKRRGAQKGRDAEEIEAMAQTAARYVIRFCVVEPVDLSSGDRRIFC